MELAEARLTESRDPLASLAEDGSYEKYSLLFRGLGAFLLPQDTYTFKHRALGWTEIFIVPVKEWGPQHNLYAAFFDHPRAGYFGRPAAN
jgi:hypothetical protein